jgi:hypothetical protein
LRHFKRALISIKGAPAGGATPLITVATALPPAKFINGTKVRCAINNHTTSFPSQCFDCHSRKQEIIDPICSSISTFRHRVGWSSVDVSDHVLCQLASRNFVNYSAHRTIDSEGGAFQRSPLAISLLDNINNDLQNKIMGINDGFEIFILNWFSGLNTESRMSPLFLSERLNILLRNNFVLDGYFDFLYFTDIDLNSFDIEIERFKLLGDKVRGQGSGAAELYTSASGKNAPILSVFFR